MTPNRLDLVIAGGGLAAARAIRSYREAGGEGRVVLLAAEDVLPYHRPALSKRFLRGETTDAPFVEDEAFYRDHGIEVLLRNEATAVDPAARTVTTTDGTLRFERLLVATGATPRRLRVPGAELDGVQSLRTLADSAAIRDAARVAGHAVVVGGGFIGMEVAASLRQLGAGVTLIPLGQGLFDQLGSPELSRDLVSLYRGRGVELLLGEQVSAFGGDGRLAFVETAGGRRVETELAVVGAGVIPNIGLLEGSGLPLENGVTVDANFETPADGIFAVGDVANVHDPLYGWRRRIEHWSNAAYQGAEAGRILAGGEGGYDAVSSFFTEVFGITVKVFGDVARFDHLATEGSLAAGRLLAAYGGAGRPLGAPAGRAGRGLRGQAEEPDAGPPPRGAPPAQ